MTDATVGDLIRRQRTLARRSQLDLAHEIGVSPRHLSFVELGKSKPSAGLLTRIAEELDLPLRERNDWLLAAGYAARRLVAGIPVDVRGEPTNLFRAALHPHGFAAPTTTRRPSSAALMPVRDRGSPRMIMR
ncbi:helix-turn-helix domain-containing protein [Asanoa iriomotensis]|uniref:HTH cro/C1-type domain-containing protein n=1 Tax=Asanoa iriomotensis TaxID=234613 RepID=A0ABQ4C460_9ACTN|nr:helix-turn-helix transcriptional regulator [Asanoa iriomotensis]GIF57555.1 hypothetical protein Air01nite_36500 [Asanoa iriomotensis]